MGHLGLTWWEARPRHLGSMPWGPLWKGCLSLGLALQKQILLALPGGVMGNSSGWLYSQGAGGVERGMSLGEVVTVGFLRRWPLA